MSPPHRGQTSGSTSKSCRNRSAQRRRASGRASCESEWLGGNHRDRMTSVARESGRNNPERLWSETRRAVLAGIADAFDRTVVEEQPNAARSC
jgi:hypothetical protein